MYTVFVVLGGMLVGAAAFTAFLCFVYLGVGLMVFKSEAMGWLFLPNYLLGPFAGVALGLVGALQFCGLFLAAHIAAVFTGVVLLGFVFYIGLQLFKPSEGWQQIYTWRQGIPVVIYCGVEIIGTCLVFVPFPFVAACGLIAWGMIVR